MGQGDHKGSPPTFSPRVRIHVGAWVYPRPEIYPRPDFSSERCAFPEQGDHKGSPLQFYHRASTRFDIIHSRMLESRHLFWIGIYFDASNLRSAQIALPLYEATAEERAQKVDEFISSERLAALLSRYRKAIEESISLFQFLEQKKSVSLAPAFVNLLSPLDDAATGMMLGLLLTQVPASQLDQQDFFDPYFSNVTDRDCRSFQDAANNLKKHCCLETASCRLVCSRSVSITRNRAKL